MPEVSAVSRWIIEAGAARQAIRYRLLALLCGHVCPACGQRAVLRDGGSFPGVLADEWRLSDQWREFFRKRERFSCSRCGSVERARVLASVIVREVNRLEGLKAKSLRELCGNAKFHERNVAEINSLGQLHQFLKHCPKLRYSEYGSKDANIPSEDLTNLSYSDRSIDLVLTSETLEHVPNVDQALEEIHRILKVGGLHIFTIPVVWDRVETLQRAKLDDGTLVHLHSPSFHGDISAKAEDFLVFYEFGADVVERISSAGFDVDVVRHPTNPAMAVFVTTAQ